MENKSVRFIRVRGRVVPIRERRTNSQTGMSKGVKLAAAAGVGTAAAVGTYLAMRKFRVSANPMLARLQKASESSGGISMAVRGAGDTSTRTSRVQSALFGSGVSGKDAGVVFRHQAGVSAKGTAHTVNPEYLHEAFGNKRTFGKMISQSPGAAPKTYNLDEALKMVGDNPDKLQNLFDSKRFVIKSDDSALSSFKDFVKNEDIAAATPKGRSAISNARGSVIQEIMDVKKEYRVHYLNGEVYGISHRYIPNKSVRNLWNKVSKKMGAGEGGGAFIPVVGKKRSELRKFAQEHMKNIGADKLPENESLHVAFDIADTPEGLKFIEANPSMGTFNNPIINRQFTRKATGRWGKDVSTIAGGGVGGTAAVGTYNALPEKRRKKYAR